MTSERQPDRRWSQREMALIYFGYLREDESVEPTAEDLQMLRIRRWVALGMALIALVIAGLAFGPFVVIAIAVVSVAWWAWASRADRRRDQALAARHRNR